MREFGSEFEIEYARDYYFDNLYKLKDYCALTRSGREALVLLAKSLEKGIILIPAYCCWSMELPFENEGIKIEYYRLNKNLSVDKDFLRKQIKKFNPVAILVMNYFGFVLTDDLVDMIKEMDCNIKVIEDFTQSLFCLKENFNPMVDAYVASIRKSVGVPDGGIVLSSMLLDDSLLSDGEDTIFVKEHIVAGRKKMQYRYSRNVNDKVEFRERQSSAGKDIKENYGLYRISNESRSIIEHTIVDNVRVARFDNYKHLYDLIKDISCVDVLFEPSNSNQAPFAMVICVENRDDVQKKMAKDGVYAQLLWPLKDKAKSICDVSKYMEEHMLAIPIDQRYSYDDIEEMGNRIKNIL